jgi:hypothetical protein
VGSVDDDLQNTCQVSQHIRIPKSKNAITLRRKPPITLNVTLSFGVLATIDFDNEAPLVAREIDDE